MIAIKKRSDRSVYIISTSNPVQIGSWVDPSVN